MTELLNMYVGAKGAFVPGEWTSALEVATRAISAAADNIKSHEATNSREEYFECRDPKGHVLTCEACGIRRYEDAGNYRRVLLSSVLVLSVNANIQADYDQKNAARKDILCFENTKHLHYIMDIIV
jgi:hypothetical protein